MEHLVKDLGAQAWVLDLGAGGGSFNYASTAATVVALDLDFPASPAPPNARRVKAGADGLPLGPASIDAVVCNHTLEHFENLSTVLAEVRRVLKPGGLLWAAVPDGYSLDDRLYRYLFDGGGHVNQFHFQDFISTVERGAEVTAQDSKGLNTGFVYLYPPPAEKLPHYADRAQRLAEVPPRWLRRGSVLLNYLARTLEKAGWKGLSRYGWGVVFRRAASASARPQTATAQTATAQAKTPRLSTRPEDWNVCCCCGAGHPEESLRPLLKRGFLWLKLYRCPLCGQANLYSRPPRRYAREASAGGNKL